MTAVTPVLDGYGVRLRPLTLDEVGPLHDTHDDATWKFMSETGSTTALLHAFVERTVAGMDAGTCQAWVSTVLKDDGTSQVVGCSRLADLNWQHRTGEVGWTWVAPSYRGTGLNVRVKLLQLRHAFETLKLRRVALKTHHGNLASQRAILKLGAKYEGAFRNHIIMPDGSSRDTLWYSILDSEWPEVERHLLERIEKEPLPATA